MASIRARRRAFTLAELLIVITIITILSTIALVAMYGVIDQAKEQRTQVQIARLHSIVMEKWESYRTRAVPLRLTYKDVPSDAKYPALALAAGRLAALRELMRMEMPDRIVNLNALDVSGARKASWVEAKYIATSGSTDVEKTWFIGSMPIPSLWSAYRRQAKYAGRFNPSASATWTAPTTWSEDYERAECLYLIVANTIQGEDSALKFFQEAEIGDVDGDGMKEILDAWGKPIMFFRWAPGFTYDPGPDGKWGQSGIDDDGNTLTDDIGDRGYFDDQLLSDVQIPDGTRHPDAFDPLHADSRWQDSIKGNEPFALIPLIFSAGRDKLYGNWFDVQTAAITSFEVENDPYHITSYNGNDVQFGMFTDDMRLDNITNHLIEAK
jgi:prepilin-type N-terminal cleavage/methylation domain-containing protein